MRIGIFGGTGSQSIDDIVAAARSAEQDGFASYSLPQIFGLDAMGLLAIIGREVPRIELAHRSSCRPTRGTRSRWRSRRSPSRLASGGRFTLGIGLSHQMVIENMFGLSFDKPLRHMREYLSVLVPLLNDEPADFDGETISTHVAIDVGRAAPHRRDRRRARAEDARARGHRHRRDRDVDDRPRDAGRRTPFRRSPPRRRRRAGPRRGSYSSLPICVTADVDAARERAAKDFQVYGFLPSYRAMLDREGAAGPADVAIVGDEADGRRRAWAAWPTPASPTSSPPMFGNRDERAATRALLQSML